MRIQAVFVALGLFATNLLGQCYQFSSGSAASIMVTFVRLSSPSSPSSGVYQYDGLDGLRVSAVVTIGQKTYSATNVDVVDVTVSDSVSLNLSQFLLNMAFTTNGTTVGALVHFAWDGNFFQGGKLPASLPSVGSASYKSMIAGANFVNTQYTPTSISGCSGSPVGPSSAPAISKGGIVPIGSAEQTISPGAWFSIYGTNLAGSTTSWSGNFPTSLAGTSVSVNGKPAYLSYVSAGQINAQAPTDGSMGSAQVVVTTSGGSSSASVAMAAVAPSLFLLDSRHVAGVILRANNSGAYGSYDILGPTGYSLGYRTVAAAQGDTVELFGTGLGPTNPSIPAGQLVTRAAPITGQAQLRLGGALVTPTFVGLSQAGVYQINFVMPHGLGIGDVQIVLTINGLSTPLGNVMSLQ